MPCTISDRVPEQCDVTGNVQIIGVECHSCRMAKRILDQHAEYAGTNRTEGTDKVTKAGFDIKANAEWLQRFYVDALAESTRV